MLTAVDDVRLVVGQPRPEDLREHAPLPHVPDGGPIDVTYVDRHPFHNRSNTPPFYQQTPRTSGRL